MFDEQQNITN